MVSDKNVEFEESEILFGYDDDDVLSQISDDQIDEDCLSPDDDQRSVKIVEQISTSKPKNEDMRRFVRQSSRSVPATSYLKAAVSQNNRENQWRIKYLRTLIGPDKLRTDVKDPFRNKENSRGSLSTPIDIPRTTVSSINDDMKRRIDSENDSFVPPHQLVHRACFSLGMYHHFRHKPGEI